MEKDMMRTDLILHFLAGFFIATLFQFNFILMVIAVAVIGLGKELYDKFVKKTTFDFKDLAYTLTGGFVGYWIVLIYN
jgi:mannose/fructose/N-acetylgalactosamine-specific phosphotransferase system component IIC